MFVYKYLIYPINNINRDLLNIACIIKTRRITKFKLNKIYLLLSVDS